MTEGGGDTRPIRAAMANAPTIKTYIMPKPSSSTTEAVHRQDPKAVADRTQSHATEKASHSDMGPAELLSEHMDDSGNAVPDPSWTRQSQDPNDKEQSDLFEAMNADTSEFA
jgi:hypothetical protein